MAMGIGRLARTLVVGDRLSAPCGLVLVALLAAPPIANAGQGGLPAAPQGQAPAGGSAATVIVPFANLSGEAADDWIAVGIAEALAIGFPPGAAVIAAPPGGAALTGAEDRLSLALDAGRRQGGRQVVSGEYQRIGETMQITGRLVDLASGSVIRSTQVSGEMNVLFNLQDQIVAGLAGPPSVEALDRTPSPPAPPAPAVDARSDPPAAVSGAGATLAETGSAGAVAPLTAGVGDNLLALIDGPPPPVAPAVMNRDAAGRTTVRAIKLTTGIRIDGALDEAVYQEVPAISDFIQQVPVEGATASEKTEAWIMFDETNVYVSARVWDSAPESEWVANEMRRDTSQLRQNDTFTAFFDTFYDRRNGFNFYTNPLGARADQQFTNEGNPNGDWNPVWDVRTGRFDGGWTVEMEIPFKTLRYRSGSPQMWGVQLRRAIRRKNEWVYLTRLPISAGGGSGSAGIFMVSAAGTLVGIEPPPASRNIEVKPYAIGGITRDAVGDPGGDHVRDGDYGLDVKYGITQNLTADLTYNTDFAQVEVDEQQVNLTRFSLFFPEKREFFLEGRGVFDFARGGVGGGFGGPGGGGGGGGGGFFGGGNAPTLFYSRRIGLQDREIVPILGGGRVTGKIGQFSVGALSITTDDEMVSDRESTNFTVARIKRDILRRSTIGGIFTNRTVSLSGEGQSRTYGADATFAFYDNVQMLGYYARTETPDLVGKDTSYQARFGVWGRPLRHAGRPPARGRQLLTGSGVPAAGQLPPHLRRGPVQSAAAIYRVDPAVPSDRQRRLYSDRGHGLAGDAAEPPAVPDRDGKQRSIRGNVERQLRVVADAVHAAGRRLCHSGRRLWVQGRRTVLCARPTAPGQRVGVPCSGADTSTGRSRRWASARDASRCCRRCRSSRVSRSTGLTRRWASTAPTWR